MVHDMHNNDDAFQASGNISLTNSFRAWQQMPQNLYQCVKTTSTSQIYALC